MAATKPARKPATGNGHTPVEGLQGALDELTKAVIGPVTTSAPASTRRSSARARR